MLVITEIKEYGYRQARPGPDVTDKLAVRHARRGLASSGRENADDRTPPGGIRRRVDAAILIQNRALARAGAIQCENPRTREQHRHGYRFGPHTPVLDLNL